MAGTVSKNKSAGLGKYSYKYADIAQIHEYLESINASYYQFNNVVEGKQFVFTVRIINGEEKPPLMGAEIIQTKMSGANNPAQEYGSALTYARRYSLLMAFGLATEDDDAQSLTQKPQKVETAVKTPQRTITPEEELMLEQLIVAFPAEDPVSDRIKKICTANHVESLGDLTKTQYNNLLKQLGGNK